MSEESLELKLLKKKLSEIQDADELVDYWRWKEKYIKDFPLKERSLARILVEKKKIELLKEF